MEIEGDLVVNYEEESGNGNNNFKQVSNEDFDKNVEMINDNNDKNDNVSINKNNSSISRAVDRKKTCPFMVKMYCRINGHHRSEEFTPPRFPVEDEMIVYTWKDASLKELSLLVRQVLGDSELPGGLKGNDANLKFSFNLLYPDVKRQGAHFIVKSMGWAFEGGEIEAQNLQLVDSSSKTLDNFRFVPGDFIDVAIFTNPAMIPKPIRSYNNNTNSKFNRDDRRIFSGKQRRRF